MRELNALEKEFLEKLQEIANNHNKTVGGKMTESDRYILDGKTPVAEPDLMKWAEFFESGNRVVRQNNFGQVRVSTVFLGIDHSFGFGPPLLFETMVFGGELDQEQDRCLKWEEAEKMHERMCERVKAAINK
jgi:hypothetical protein